MYILHILSILLSFLLSLIIAATTVRYDHHTLVRIPTALHHSEGNLFASCHVFTHDAVSTVVLVENAKLDTIKAKASAMGGSVDVIDENIQDKIDAESQRLATAKTRLGKSSSNRVAAMAVDGAGWFTDFHPFVEIVQWCSELSQKYPTIVTLIPSIGKTTNGLDIPVLQITGAGGASPTKKRIYVEAMLHAREWIAGSTALYLAYYLTTNYAPSVKPPTFVTQLLDTYVYIVVPVANPDGYIHTWEADRFWRKNMYKTANGTLIGVDLNRNFPEQWSVPGGASDNPREEIYRGPTAASEPETKALMAFFKSIPNVYAAFDLHSFSQLILRPNSWTKDAPPDDANLKQMAEGMRDRIARDRGVKYTAQKSVELYPVSGDVVTFWRSSNFGKDGKGLVAFAMELSPTSDAGIQGFVASPKEIIKVGQEITNGIMWVAGQQVGINSAAKGTTWLWLVSVVLALSQIAV